MSVAPSGHVLVIRKPLLFAQKCLERFNRRRLEADVSGPEPCEQTHERPHRLSPIQSPFRPTSTPRCFRWGPIPAPYKKITTEGVRVEKVLGKDMLVVSREALRALSEAAFGDINHTCGPGHLPAVAQILDDKGKPATNDKFVAFDFLKNPNIGRRRDLADVPGHRHRDHMGKKGFRVITDAMTRPH